MDVKHPDRFWGVWVLIQRAQPIYIGTFPKGTSTTTSEHVHKNIKKTSTKPPLNIRKNIQALYSEDALRLDVAAFDRSTTTKEFFLFIQLLMCSYLCIFISVSLSIDASQITFETVLVKNNHNSVCLWIPILSYGQDSTYNIQKKCPFKINTT